MPIFPDSIARTLARESQARSYSVDIPVVFAKATGHHLVDTDGNRYLDLLMGAGALLLGHNHPSIVEAIRRQENPLVNSLDLMTIQRADFIEAFFDSLPVPMRQGYRVHFCGGTGSDAIEAARKLAAINTGRRGVIVFSGGYHGMSQGALAVSSNRRLRESGLVSSSDVTFLPFPYPHLFPRPFRTTESATDLALASLHLALEDDHSGVSLPSMILLEVVQGEGGTVVAPPQFIQGVVESCRRHGILLCIDEIQSGLGRTGKWFAFEHYDVFPDLIAISKGIGGGFPLSLLLYRESLDVWHKGDHIGTFRGQQYGFAAGRAMLETIATGALVDQAAAAGAKLRSMLEDLAAQHSDLIAEIRGLGLFLGIEMADTDVCTATELAARVQGRLLHERVIVERGGRRGSVIRLLPPLTMTDGDIDDFAQALGGVLSYLSRWREGSADGITERGRVDKCK